MTSELLETILNILLAIALSCALLLGTAVDWIDCNLQPVAEHCSGKKPKQDKSQRQDKQQQQLSKPNERKEK